jgi:hypothetical protein
MDELKFSNDALDNTLLQDNEEIDVEHSKEEMDFGHWGILGYEEW